MSSDTGDLNILVISFYFPPYDKVGGRRWAKHCKYFEKEKINFSVLAGDFKGTSAWDKDINSYTDKITRVRLVRKYNPYHLRTLPTNVFQKIKWKFSLLTWEKKKLTLNENYNDVSLANENNFAEKARNIINKNQINTVILSVGPFSYSRILPQLKTEFPDIRFVIDYRDYWEDNFRGLTPEQIKLEKNLQQKVIDSVSLILSPNNEMKDFYSRTFSKPSYKLPHCIDLEDLADIPEVKRENKNAISILYGGAFYSDIEENLELIRQLTEKLNIVKETTVEFYVSLKGFEKELHHPKIKRFGFIDTKKYFEKVKQSDYVILILPPNRVNAMSSKFYELVALGKPILYFGGTGEVSDFVIKHSLGFHITKQNMDSLAKTIVDNLSNPVPKSGYDISTHTFEFQTKKLLNELSSLLN